MMKILFLSIQNGKICISGYFSVLSAFKKRASVSLIEQFQYRHAGNGRDLCGTKDMSTRITDIVVNEAIIHTGIDRRSRSPVRSWSSLFSLFLVKCAVLRNRSDDLFEVLVDRWKRYRKFRIKVGSDRIAN